MFSFLINMPQTPFGTFLFNILQPTKSFFTNILRFFNILQNKPKRHSTNSCLFKITYKETQSENRKLFKVVEMWRSGHPALFEVIRGTHRRALLPWSSPAGWADWLAGWKLHARERALVLRWTSGARPRRAVCDGHAERNERAFPRSPFPHGNRLAFVRIWPAAGVMEKESGKPVVRPTLADPPSETG